MADIWIAGGGLWTTTFKPHSQNRVPDFQIGLSVKAFSSAGDSYDDPQAICAAVNRFNEFRAHLFVKPPHHPEEADCDLPHPATFWHIWMSSKERLYLSLSCPPVMDRNGVVHENDCVTGI